ncbi:hypothetical protein [Oceanibaculum nanhaiense]|uniref:hypothetical protein n=1 Tax=Oceanibaculum nanhaiense TaxID=1909734 RepID=UPI003D288EE0
MTEAYPLHWPAGRPRRQPQDRKRASFGKVQQRAGQSWSSKSELSVADAMRRLQDEMDRMGARLPVVSSNVELRLDGLPRSGQREPQDPGVAVYFQLNGTPHCLPCDTYDRVADNIAAVAKHIEATRAIERYGVADLSEMFQGFRALPPPRPRTWREVLVMPEGPHSLHDVEVMYRRLARSRHPDNGGSTEAMAELNAAREAARKELGD